MIEKIYFEGDFALADSLLRQLEKTDGRSLRSNPAFLKLKGINHYYHFELESAEQKFLLGFDLALASNHLQLQAELGEWLGHVYMKRNEPTVAVRVYKEALEIRNKANLSSGLSDFYLNFFLASAHYAWGLQEKEKEDLPFLRTNWSQGSKLIPVSGYDSLVYSFLEKAIQSIPRVSSSSGYQPSLLFTVLPQLAISPDKYEGMLNNLAPALKEETKYSPIIISLFAQAAVWHLGYYQYLLEDYGKVVPAITRRPDTDFLKVSTFTKKGRLDAKQVNQNINRLHKRNDLVGFYFCMAVLQKAIPTILPNDQLTLSRLRNQVGTSLSAITDRYRNLYLFHLEQIEAQKSYVQKLKDANATDRLNQIDVNLEKDTELYADYLLRNTYTLDSTIFCWYHKNLTALDNKLPLRLERNPNSTKIESLSPLQEPALEALLQKADYLYALAKVRMNDALALSYGRTPFELPFKTTSLVALDAKEMFMKLAVQTWRSYEEVYDRLLIHIPHAADRYYWAGRSHTHRLRALDAAFTYLPNTAKTPAEVAKMNDVFYFSERTKATVFLNDLATGMHAQLSQLTPANRLKSDSLLIQLHLAENRLRAGFKPAMDTLLRIQQQLEKILPIKSISGKDTRWKIPSLSEVQRTLNPTTAIVWWVTAPDNLYRFVLTSSQLKVSVTLRKEEKNLPLVKGMRNGIIYQREEVYRESAQTLYKRYFPNLDDQITTLILVPDKEMNLIPFEALLTERVAKKEIGKWELYPFLIKKYAVSYQPSVTSTFLRHQMATTTAHEFIGYAPIVGESPKIESKVTRALSAIWEQMEQEGGSRTAFQSGQVASLPATKHEIESIAKSFDEKKLLYKTFLAQEAVEKNFYHQPITSSTILHLATHGFANPHRPAECGILMADILYPTKDDGVLYGYEIASMNLPARLITLSACETGLGKVIAGEGSLSLTRSFLLAGSQNMLSSLWKVPDAETSALMISFYKTLTQQPLSNFSTPLQTAKLDMIKSGKGDPYYWSSFILTGF